MDPNRKHPTPGEITLNRIREGNDKQKQFEEELLRAGRTEEQALSEAFRLAELHLKGLEMENPDCYKWPPYVGPKKKYLVL
jgi:hypothetical protein